MKILQPEVKIFEQAPGIEGLLKHIERVGRLAYKSEDRITDTSHIKFVEMLKNRGHWAVFNLGTVYLVIPMNHMFSAETVKDCVNALEAFKKHAPFTRITEDTDNYYVTTDYRTICQEELEDFMERYWSEPGEHHKLKITTEWHCSRVIAQQVLRHRLFSPLMESTRYVNYSLDRFELGFSLPCWMKREMDKSNIDYEQANLIVHSVNPEFLSLSKTFNRRIKGWMRDEEDYLEDIKDGLKPEDARGGLALDVATTFAFCGYLEDFTYTPKDGSKEKAGFFYLRCAPDAQEDVRILAESLKEQFKSKNLI